MAFSPKNCNSRVNVVKVVEDLQPAGIREGAQLPAQLESSVQDVALVRQPDVEGHLLGLVAAHVAVGPDGGVAKAVAVPGAKLRVVLFQHFVDSDRVAQTWRAGKEMFFILKTCVEIEAAIRIYRYIGISVRFN